MGLSSFVPAQLIAQSWCPPEARWGYDMGHPWGYASVDMVFCGGDTLVDGHQAIKMMRSSVTTQLMGNDTLITGTGLFRIMREDQGVVFQWHHNLATWDTLFWFTANPGDHWIPPLAWQGFCEPHMELHVDDTSTVMIDGISLRQLEVRQFQEDFGFSDPFPIIERIGYMHHYFHLMPTCMGVFECYCQFNCYSDAQMSYPVPGACDHTLGVDVELPVTTFELLPNPGHDSFIVSASADEQITIRIYEPAGRLISGPFTFKDQLQVDMSAFPRSTYLIALRSATSSVVRQWIKQ